MSSFLVSIGTPPGDSDPTAAAAGRWRRGWGGLRRLLRNLIGRHYQLDEGQGIQRPA